jgi:hypothetical protein
MPMYLERARPAWPRRWAALARTSKEPATAGIRATASGG